MPDKRESTVEVQNYIDDTGRQAAEAVLALRLSGRGPGAAKDKFDHYVGEHYVRLNEQLSEGYEDRTRELETQLVEVLHEMEQGAHRHLVERILRAQLETAARIGASYDLLVWESDIVRARLLDEALDVLKASPRVRVPSEGKYAGALVIELEPRSAVDEDGGAFGCSSGRTACRPTPAKTFHT